MRWVLKMSIAALVYVPVSQGQGVEYALTASSSFELAVSRTEEELGSLALRLIREATAEHIYYESLQIGNTVDVQLYRSVEVVTQSVQFEAPSSSTNLRFFVLASALTSVGSDSQIERQSALDSLVDTALNSPNQTDLLLHRVRVKEATNRDSINLKASEQLRAIDSIVFVTGNSSPTMAPAPSAEGIPSASPIRVAQEPAPRKKALSTLDIVLIVISGLILIGVVWMICVHHRDQGYFEKQRLRALNTGPARLNADTEAANREARLALTDKKSSSSDLAPADTPSTADASSPSFEALSAMPSSNSIQALRPILKKPELNALSDQAVADSHVMFMSNQFSERSGRLDPQQLLFVASELTSDDSGAHDDQSSDGDGSEESIGAMTGRSTGGSDLQPSGGSLSEPFDSNWFRRSDIMGATSLSQLESEDSEETNSDVFHVASPYDAAQTRSPAEMYEWLRSLHVVAGGSRGSRGGSSSSSGSQQSETGNGPFEVSSISHLSLEQSMMASAVASRSHRSTGSL
jgi:hypothetical protein